MYYLKRKISEKSFDLIIVVEVVMCKSERCDFLLITFI